MLRCVCYVNTHADANVDCKADTILSFSFYLCLIVLCYSDCVMLRRAVRVRMRTDWFGDAHMLAGRLPWLQHECIFPEGCSHSSPHRITHDGRNPRWSCCDQPVSLGLAHCGPATVAAATAAAAEIRMVQFDVSRATRAGYSLSGNNKIARSPRGPK